MRVAVQDLFEGIASHFCARSRGPGPFGPCGPGRCASSAEWLRGEEYQEVEAMIMVGKPAPDFTAPAYFNGKFTHVRLSEHLNKWVLLFFYGGDYTFV